MTDQDNGYWYLASYPKSGNTWCRVFITELLRLSEEDAEGELNLNQDVETGSIASSRHWLDDQLGINTCDLSFAELDPLRGRAGEKAWLFAEGERFHKVHDAFRSPDSMGRPVVSTSGCKGVVYIMRHPEDVAVSLSHFFSWDLARCVEFLLDPMAGLVMTDRHGGHQVRQYMGRWGQHVISWVDQQQIPVLVMRYEDMLAKGSETFLELAKFLDLPNQPELVNQALENTSIDRLKKLEDQVGGFSEKPEGCERFFRSGRTGEGAEKLSFEQRQKLASSLDVVMKRFDYRGPQDG
ncbi:MULTISPECIES: sulfotransferase domain-containing protein [unclassified Prochlorococcus]|uniref:sulfotransferase domain-containing protein n=1 Tax=unclassified Prochlorococcus TaxID=2627481 RepID=UPI0005339DBA|nr:MULTISPECIES: sulfotransferase domain-containing protein [unclassified Prochlorococcus]KGG26543.1 Sulfotransferase [Prochlorococcus sp. MIT 0701]KGG30098.1 Sulfotransferase [Prochlorococcus sp. MIT 0702]KGG33245.1 Sulfotransferase [Prochlorococcus sp. MIT 0703]